ncbi:MAG: peptidoglycan DD-metalloendopeptidase family protein [Patescibacteria group bacterium]
MRLTPHTFFVVLLLTGMAVVVPAPLRAHDGDDKGLDGYLREDLLKEIGDHPDLPRGGSLDDSGGPPTTLRDLIELKAKELQVIQTQRNAVQKDLDELAKSSAGLKRELNLIDGNINQLNFSIKANTLTIEKLDLETKALENDIADFERNISGKKQLMAKLFLELQQREHENLLIMFLKSKSLSESVTEAQNLVTVNTTLSSSITEFKRLQAELSSARDAAEEKRRRKEVQQVGLLSRQTIVKEQKTEKQRFLSETKNKESVYQTQLSELKRIQDDLSEEIGKYETELRKNIDPNLLPLPRPGVFIWPVDGGSLTQGYGRTAFALRTYRSQWHNGIDIGAPLGTEIFAAENGTVINVGNQDAYRGCYKAGYGKFIVVKHTNGLTTLYGHLSGYIVSIGQAVARGQVIGYLGRTGWATGPHLHFTVFASQTLAPAKPGMPEGTRGTNVCGPMPVGGDLNPTLYVDTSR